MEGGPAAAGSEEGARVEAEGGNEGAAGDNEAAAATEEQIAFAALQEEV